MRLHSLRHDDIVRAIAYCQCKIIFAKTGSIQQVTCQQMPTEQRYKFLTSALKVLFFLFFPLTASLSHAATLGRLTVLSSLGQPLRAEVELTSVSPEEASSLAASLAPGEAYKRSGIDYTPLLQSLNISVVKDGDRYFVSIRSAQPVNEPYIGVLLELAADNERKGREYVIMLDPAEWTNLRSAPLSSAASMQRLSRQQHAGRLSSRALPVTAVRPASVIPEKEVQPGTRTSTEYVVSRGDSLSKIVGRIGIRNISLEQMLVALYRNNPDAFLGDNMNLLKEGAVLSVPSAADAGDVSRQDARQIVRLHAVNFRGYSHRLAGMVQKSAPRATAKTGPVAEGKVSASVKEQPSPVSKMPDRLELSKAGPGAVSAGITVEEKAAITKAVEDAERRITELEKNVNELRNLLNIVSKNGNTLTRPAEDAVPEPQPKTPETQPETAKPQEEPTAQEPAKTDTDSPQTVTGTIEKTPSSDTDASSEEKKVGVDPDQSLTGKKAEPAKKADDEDESDEEENTKKKQDFLSNAIWYVAIGVTLAVLVMIVLVLRMRRKKPAALSPAPAPVLVVKSQEYDAEEEDINPNIISGRDFLESVTGREVVDDEGDEDEDAYRPMMDGDGDDEDDDPYAQYEDEDVLEEIVSTEGEEDEPEEVAVEPDEGEDVPEDVASRPEEIPEEIEPEPEEEEEAQEQEEKAVSQEPVSERETVDVDEGDMALAFDDSDEPEEEAIESEEEEEDEPVPLELDLSDIDLEPEVAKEEAELPDVAFSAEEEKPEPYNAEMAAKLELAQAYLDMRDKEGARELLEEVVERGTPRQIDEAQQLMQYL